MLVVANKAPRAFSLIETTIAIGIAATTIVAVLGVLSTSALHINDADRKTAQARISRELIAEVSLSEWDSLDDYHHRKYKFDAEGNRLDSDTRDSDFFAYLARIELSKEADDKEKASANKNDGDEDGEKSAEPVTRRVTVKITNFPISDYDFDSSTRRQYATFSTWISKMDRRP